MVHLEHGAVTFAAVFGVQKILQVSTPVDPIEFLWSLRPSHWSDGDEDEDEADANTMLDRIRLAQQTSAPVFLESPQSAGPEEPPEGQLRDAEKLTDLMRSWEARVESTSRAQDLLEDMRAFAKKKGDKVRVAKLEAELLSLGPRHREKPARPPSSGEPSAARADQRARDGGGADAAVVMVQSSEPDIESGVVR
tara:strand:+ start:1150 stop:1731 length:582 start_codon:yes stop_codon:yes gene_type:complete